MIFIVGCPRSGTTLTVQILKALGASFGETNPLGEHMGMKTVLKDQLRSLGCDPLGQRKLPSRLEDRPHSGLAKAAERHFSGLPQPWAFKDCKVALVWRAWAREFPDAKWIIVRRDRDEIVDSCIRTPFMRAYGDDRKAWGQWVDEHSLRFDDMKAAGLDLIEVWPRTFINDPSSFLPVADHCGLGFNEDAVMACVDPKRYKHV